MPPTSRDSFSFSAFTGGSVAWLPRRISGFRDFFKIEIASETKSDMKNITYYAFQNEELIWSFTRHLQHRTERYKKSFHYLALKDWDNTPINIGEQPTLKTSVKGNWKRIWGAKPKETRPPGGTDPRWKRLFLVFYKFSILHNFVVLICWRIFRIKKFMILTMKCFLHFQIIKNWPFLFSNYLKLALLSGEIWHRAIILL